MATLRDVKETVQEFKRSTSVDRVVVMAGAAMFFHGLRNTFADIDLFVPGGKDISGVYGGFEVDAHGEWFGLDKDILEHAIEYEGVLYCGKKELLATYRILNRAKDQQWIELLEVLK